MAAPTIDEAAIFPTDISRGAVGGPAYSTVVVISASGSEQRVAQRSQGLYQWDVSHGMKTAAQARALIAFFHARQGKARGFRFQDWNDYTTVNEPLASAAGGPTLQLIKTYTSGGIARVRTIYKPMVSPAATLRRNASAFAAFSLDTATGIVTLTPQAGPFAITGINQAGNATITIGGGYTGIGVPQVVYFTGITGMTQLNGTTATVAATPDGTHFSILTDTTGFTPYVSGGTVARYYAITDTWDWLGSFHVPMRFDVDQIKATLQDVDYVDFEGIPVVELLG